MIHWVASTVSRVLTSDRVISFPFHFDHTPTFVCAFHKMLESERGVIKDVPDVESENCGPLSPIRCDIYVREMILASRVPEILSFPFIILMAEEKPVT